MTDRLDLLCLGEPLLELNQEVGDTAGGRLYREGFGGDASNVAIAAARQGARAGFLSAVGDDPAGEGFLALWRQEGVDASAVRVDASRPTGLYFVSHEAGGHHFSYRRAGSAASRYTLDARAEDEIARASIFFASGISLALSDTAADTVFAAMAQARAGGGRVAFDTNYRPQLWPRHRAAALIEHAMRRADIALPGLEDATLLLGLTEPDAIVDLCLSLGPTLVVLKMGAAGCLVATPGWREVIAAHPCRPVDATGAGDTFCGSFLAEIAREASPREAAVYAGCAAALSTAGYGAVPPIPRRAVVLQALAARRSEAAPPRKPIATSARPVALVGDRCGEGAIWCAEESAVYWVDISRFVIHRLVWPEGRLTSWLFDEPPTALALTTAPGRLLVALASRLIWWWPADDRRADHGVRLPGHPRVRFNDGRADPRGQFWVGSMFNNVTADGGPTDEHHAPGNGALFRVTPDGQATEELTGVGIANTLCWSPDRTRFYFADTMRNELRAYPYDMATGDIGRGEVHLSDFSRGVPDGSAIDADGYLWNCRWGGGGLVRIAPDGTVDGFHEIPTLNPTTCVFGGPDLTTLFITSARNDADPADRLAGSLWAMQAGVPGLAENRVSVEKAGEG